MTILVVDDDPHIRDVICFALEKAGYAHKTAADGKQALQKASVEKFDLVVLDIGLPEMDGLEVCREIRKTSDMPVLFLSARDEEIDRILGLEMGGDDYVTKPFSPRELVARIKAILKRSAMAARAPDEQIALEKGSLAMNRDARLVTFNTTPIRLTALEFSIIHALLRRPDMVFSREQLMNTAWDASIHVSDRTIDSHIRNIRAKFVDAGCDNAVETVHGIGFRLGACVLNDASPVNLTNVSG